VQEPKAVAPELDVTQDSVLRGRDGQSGHSDFNITNVDAALRDRLVADGKVNKKEVQQA